MSSGIIVYFLPMCRAPGILSSLVSVYCTNIYYLPMTCQAEDPDATSSVVYSLVGGDPTGLFTIDPNTGRVRVANESGLDMSDLKTDHIILTVEVNSCCVSLITYNTRCMSLILNIHFNFSLNYLKFSN